MLFVVLFDEDDGVATTELLVVVPLVVPFVMGPMVVAGLDALDEEATDETTDD